MSGSDSRRAVLAHQRVGQRHFGAATEGTDGAWETPQPQNQAGSAALRRILTCSA
jgi:hypothetical protein